MQETVSILLSWHSRLTQRDVKVTNTYQYADMLIKNKAAYLLVAQGVLQQCNSVL